jgi:hypothetical protein
MHYSQTARNSKYTDSTKLMQSTVQVSTLGRKLAFRSRVPRLVTDNPGFFGFFGFWSSMWGKGSDERIDQNVNRANACRNAFAFSMAASAIVFSYIAILRTVEGFQLAMSIGALFAGGLTIFVASFTYYDRFSS